MKIKTRQSIILLFECSKLAQKEDKTRYERMGKVTHWELNVVLPYRPILYAQNRICYRELDTEYLLGFWDSNGSPDPYQKTGSKSKEEEKMLDPGLHHRRPDLKESEKIDKHVNFARELRKLWNMKVTVEPVIIGELGTIWKNPQTSRKTVNQMNNWDHLNCAKTGYNTEESPGIIRKVYITCTLVKNNVTNVVKNRR